MVSNGIDVVVIEDDVVVEDDVVGDAADFIDNCFIDSNRFPLLY